MNWESYRLIFDDRGFLSIGRERAGGSSTIGAGGSGRNPSLSRHVQKLKSTRLAYIMSNSFRIAIKKAL